MPLTLFTSRQVGSRRAGNLALFLRKKSHSRQLDHRTSNASCRVRRRYHAVKLSQTHVCRTAATFLATTSLTPLAAERHVYAQIVGPAEILDSTGSMKSLAVCQ